jgi:ligand-binding sensor protein
MKLTDLLPVEKWIVLEKKINEKFGLNAAVFDNEGARITNYMNWGNELCPAIKKNERGKTYICALAHKNISAQIEKTGKSSIGECDAGFIKFAVPIYFEGEWLGVAGGCGRITNGNTIESFLINKITGIEEKKIKHLSTEISFMEYIDVKKAVDYVNKELEKVIGNNIQKNRQDASQTTPPAMNINM